MIEIVLYVEIGDGCGLCEFVLWVYELVVVVVVYVIVDYWL